MLKSFLLAAGDAVPVKEDFWNVLPLGKYVVYGLVIPLSIAFLWGFYKRCKMWKQGAKEREPRLDNLVKRAGFLLKFFITPQRMFHDFWAGLAHGLIMCGFLMLFVLGAVMDAINANIVHYIQGWIYLTQSLILEIGGAMVLVGIIIAVVRRYLVRPKHLEQSSQAGLILLWLFVVIITGFGVEGLRLQATELVEHPDWAAYSFLGVACGKLFEGIGLGNGAVLGTHLALWYIHMLISMGFIAYIGWSKLRHMFTSAANIFLQSTQPKGEIPEIKDIEEVERWGVGKIEELTWKQLLDLDACTRCGRCEFHCPAFATDKPLSPKKVIGDLKAQMEKFLGGDKPAAKPDEETSANEEEAREPALVGGRIEDDVLWACTTCGACVEHCPVYVSALDKIVDMRRYLVLMESRFPTEVTNVFKGMENNANPYQIGNDKRIDYLEGEEVKLLSDDSDVEILYWAGCANSYDPRNQKVAKNFIGLMKKAGVNFGMLGTEEMCCGETARRMGNEYLAQTMVQQNIEIFNNYKVKKIVTGCPHCYNTFKNEYAQFGGNYEVLSHIEYLAELIAGGRLKPVKEVKGKVMYHDSCYLGRHNGIYDAPREILAAIPGLELVEFDRNREHAFCCGCGGGRMWMEETLGTRINEARVKEGLEKNPDMLVVACPYCMTMFEDGIKAHDAEERVKARDLSEILAQSL